jgi:hypothetical protein
MNKHQSDPIMMTAMAMRVQQSQNTVLPSCTSPSTSQKAGPISMISFIVTPFCQAPPPI